MVVVRVFGIIHAFSQVLICTHKGSGVKLLCAPYIWSTQLTRGPGVLISVFVCTHLFCDYV